MSLKHPPPIDVAANTVSNAFNLGSGLVGSGTYRDSVGVTDAEDYYQFNLNVASALDLSLTEAVANLDVQLLNSNGTILQTAAQSGSASESIRRSLEAGTYYVRVFAAEGSSPYRLSLRVNNSPVLVTNAPLSLNEGNSANLTRDLLRVTDADNIAEQLVYTVNSLPSSGSLSLNGASVGVGGTFTQVDLDDGRRLVYQQNGSEALIDSFRFTVSDGSSVLSGNTFTIQVTGVNDPPVLTAPIARSVDQNVNSAISGIAVTDADVGSATVSVTLTAVNGVLSLSSTTLPDLRFSQGDGSDDRSMLFTGTLSTVNAALQTLIYRSDATFQGTDTISILVDDNGNTGLGGRLTDNKSITVTVTPVNRPPLITLPAVLTAEEDISRPIGGISITDADAGGGNLTVSVSAANGALSLASTAGVLLTAGTGNRNLVFSGPLSSINAALSTLSYLGDRNFSGSDAIVISVSDNGNTGSGTALSDTKTLAVTVAPVNDQPVLTVPAVQSVNENQDLRLSGISVSDVDAGSGSLSVNISAVNGTLSLGSTTGVTITPDSQPTRLSFSGTLSALNTALGSLIYRSNPSYNGSDTINLRVTDNGNTGAGFALSDSRTIDVNVLGVNSAPVITLPASPATSTGAELQIPGISVSDLDAGANAVTVSIAASNGALTVPASADVTFLQGTGPAGNRITFQGSLAAVNSVLAGLTYRSNPGYVGFEQLSVSVSDNGNSGIGSPLSDTEILLVNVGGAINAPPVVRDDTYSVDRNVGLTISGAGVLANDTDADGNSLTANLVSAPARGNLSFNSNGSFVYTPNRDVTGVDVFTYRASDRIAASASLGTVSITVIATNTAPVARDDSYSVGANTSLNILPGGVLSNDTDAENNPLTATLINGPTRGSLTFNSNGSFSYTPNPNVTGSDSFTYRANDGIDNAATLGTVNLSITNTAPVAVNDSYAVALNTPQTITGRGVLGNDTDTEGNTLTATLVNGPTRGNLSFNTDGSFVYTPNPNTIGVDTFTYRANDRIAASNNLGTVTLSVTGTLNTPPVAQNDSYSVAANRSISIPARGVLTNDTDAENSPLTATLVAGPTRGSLAFNGNGSFVYTPNPNSIGSDSFTYRANDGTTDALSLGTVNLSITNTAPVAVNDSYSGLLNGSISTASPGVLSNDTDTEGNALTATLVTGPTRGSLSFNSNGSFVYTPNPNTVGVDTFTYRASDQLADAIGTVTLSITGTLNTPPVAQNDSYSVGANTSLNIPARGVLTNDTDAENSPLTATLVTGPTRGSLSFNSNGSFVYTPNSNTVGADSFTYRANDGSIDSTIATVNLSVTNTAPIAVNDTYDVSFNSPRTIAAGGVLTNDTDTENNSLTASLVNAPTRGNLSFNSDGSFVYTPNLNATGLDSFTYRVSDRIADSASLGTVTLSIAASPNTPPVAQNDSYSVAANRSISIPARGVLTNDTDAENSPLTATLVTGPTRGSLSFNADGSFVYTPNSNTTGTDSFTYRANDGSTDALSLGTVVLSVTNTAPVAVNDSYSGLLNSSISTASPGVLSNDTDTEGNALTATLVTGPTRGSLSFNSNGSFVYTPNPNTVGVDTFTYRASDQLADAIGTVTLSVTGTLNTPPVVLDDSYSVGANTSLNIPARGVLTNDTDAENSPLTATLVAGPTRGSLAFNGNGSFVYTPNPNSIGSDSFTYRANDGTTDALSLGTVNLSITNTAPVAVNDSYSGLLNGSISTASPGVLSNDTDTEGNALTATLVTGPTRGSLSFNSNGSFVYTPNPNTVGVDTFTYRASDQLADAIGTVTLSITGTLNTPPIAQNDSYSTARNTLRSIGPVGVLGNDTDAEGDPLTATLVVSPTNGTLAFNSNGSFTYLPFSNYFGPDSFVYQVSDGANLSNPATVSLSVTVGVNTPPVANNDSYRVIAGASGTISSIEGILSNDTDAENDPRTAVLATTTANGALSLNPNGSFVYTPNSNFTVGIDTFTYRVSDGIATSELATVAISVGSNTPPTASADTYQIPVGGRSISAIDGLRNNDIDPDGDALTTVSLVANPSNGVLNLNPDGSFNYTPNATFTSGVDTFTYRVSDGLAVSNIATVTLSVSPNAVPIARDDTYRAARGTVNAGSFNGILQNDTDADGSSLTATVVSTPANGVLTLNQNGSFSYQANPAFTQGIDTFTYRVSDGIATSNLATVTLSVAPNSAPVAVNDSYTVTGTSLVVPGPGILVNDVDADGDPLEIRVTRLTAGGSLFVISDRTRPDYGSFRYTPFTGFRGTDFFVYELSDGISSSNSATVNLTVG